MGALEKRQLDQIASADKFFVVKRLQVNDKRERDGEAELI